MSQLTIGVAIQWLNGAWLAAAQCLSAVGIYSGVMAASAAASSPVSYSLAWRGCILSLFLIFSASIIR